MRHEEPFRRSHGRDIGDGGGAVASGVVVWGEHVPFRVDGVIVAPVGDGCDGHGVGERAGLRFQSFQS